MAGSSIADGGRLRPPRLCVPLLLAPFAQCPNSISEPEAQARVWASRDTSLACASGSEIELGHYPRTPTSSRECKNPIESMVCPCRERQDHRDGEHTMPAANNPFGSRSILKTSAGDATVYRLDALAKAGVGD